MQDSLQLSPEKSICYLLKQACCKERVKKIHGLNKGKNNATHYRPVIFEPIDQMLSPCKIIPSLTLSYFIEVSVLVQLLCL